MATEEILSVVLLMTSHWARVLREESFCAPKCISKLGALSPPEELIKRHVIMLRV